MMSPYEDRVALARPGMLWSTMGLLDKTDYLVNTSPIDTVSVGANTALFVKLYNPRPFRATTMFYYSGTTGGDNFDLGIYRRNGASLTRLGSTGSSSVTAGVHAEREPLTSPVDVPEGEIVLAFVLSGALAEFQRQDIAAFEDYAHLWGWGQQASAFPLPATATPVAATLISSGPPILGIVDLAFD